jgi:redox-sensitive bicupin YhaK (pirin superfamily)
VVVSVQVRRGLHRFVTRVAGRQTRHSFSFGEFHDPERLSFGPLVAFNDDLLGTGIGYDAHPHADVVIVTWVVSGTLAHTDESGPTEVGAGCLLIDRAGTGTTHSEYAVGGPTRYLQMWLRPDVSGGEPSLRLDPAEPKERSSRTLIADGAEELGIAGASLRLWYLAAGEVARLPEAPHVYAFVVTGALARSSMAEPLAAGDAFEISAEDDSRAGRDLRVTAAVPTSMLVWSFA